VRYNSVLFDLDGTLIDNSEGILNGFKYALTKLGRAGDADKLTREVIGPPLRSSFITIFGMSEEQTEEAVRLYREFFRPTGVYQCALYPHVEDMLARLKSAGMGVYLATSKARVFAETILEHKNLMRYFDGVVGSELDGRMDDKTEIVRHLVDQVLKPGYLPTVMVGDRSLDAEGALGCGVDSAAALWGFGSKEEFLPYENVKGMFEDAGALCGWLLEDGRR
jgi:phosphoglycolate phosphatase